MKRVLLHALILMAGIHGYGQQKFTISGVISDGESGEALIGASVYHSSSQVGAVTKSLTHQLIN